MPVRQPGGRAPQQPPQRAGHLLERGERQRLAVDRVAAEQLVGALAGQHHLDVPAGLAGDEPQRDERGVGHRVVEVPDDERQRVHHLVGLDGADDVPHADRRGRLGRDVHLRVALAVEPRGERDQVGVVLLGERRDGRRVDAAGQERADRDVGAHVLGHRVAQHGGDPAGRVLSRRRACSTGVKYRSASGSPPGAHGDVRARLDPTDRPVQRRGLRHVLQQQVVLQRRGVQVPVDVAEAQRGRELEEALLLAGERDAAGALAPRTAA